MVHSLCSWELMGDKYWFMDVLNASVLYSDVQGETCAQPKRKTKNSKEKSKKNHNPKSKPKTKQTTTTMKHPKYAYKRKW